MEKQVNIEKLVRTADGREWVQPCYVCFKIVDFIKTSGVERVRVGNLVRHKKYHPKPIV